MTGNPAAASAKAAKKRTPRSASRSAKAAKPAASGSAGPAPKSTRQGKFNAKGERVNGVWMASEAEAERYRQLLRLEMYGAITNLETQPRFDLVVNNRMIARYRADFRYDVMVEGGGTILRTVVEDIKGFETPEFRLKLALFNALHRPELTVIKPGQLRSSRATFMAAHWDGRLPPGPGEFRLPPDNAERIEAALAPT